MNILCIVNMKYKVKIINKISEHFNKQQFECKCGCKLYNLSSKLLQMLQIARISSNVQYVINSGCRCIQHNKHVGGKSDSAHLTGMAADIHYNNGFQMYNILKGLYLAGFKRIGINLQQQFIHVDIDYTKPYPTIFKY